MLKPGIYRHRHEKDYVEGSVFLGDIVLEVHETKTSFVLTLLEQNVRYDAPQIDAMFQASKRVVVKKDGSKHAMQFAKDCDEWFCLYPYRVGVPYCFTEENALKEFDAYLSSLRSAGEGKNESE